MTQTPLQRLQADGPTVLADEELIALMLSNQEAAAEVAEFVRENGPAYVANAPLAEFTRLRGVGPALAARFIAAREFSRRTLSRQQRERPVVTAEADAANLVMPYMMDLEQEEMWVLCLNTRNRVLRIDSVYRGSLNTAVVRVAEIYRTAIRINAAAIIIAHNHPSEDPTPSPEDIRVTREIRRAGETLGIELLDHLIIGGNRFISLKERGLAF